MVKPNESYRCQECNKKFNSERTVVKHILKKHQDKIQEVYSKEQTQNWIKRRIRDKIKKEMKLNYENDENKLFNIQKKFDRTETSYYFDQRLTRGFKAGRMMPSLGGKEDYVDYDDPNVNKRS